MKQLNKGQSTLEITLAFIVILMLFFGMVKLFVWGTRCIVKRDQAYMRDFTHNYDNPDPGFYTPENVSLVPDIVE